MSQRSDRFHAYGLPGIRWLSPLESDAFAEYRDASFLRLLGLEALIPKLKAFWPARGPQWDALGLDATGPILVEAKAHLAEFFSPATAAKGAAREQIAAALRETRAALGAKGGADWMDRFYQFTNRLAHLHFLRREGVDAKLVFVNFLGDDDMKGPAGKAEWDGAFRTAEYALGLPRRHALTRFIRHVHIDVRDLA